MTGTPMILSRSHAASRPKFEDQQGTRRRIRQMLFASRRNEAVLATAYDRNGGHGRIGIFVSATKHGQQKREQILASRHSRTKIRNYLLRIIH